MYVSKMINMNGVEVKCSGVVLAEITTEEEIAVGKTENVTYYKVAFTHKSVPFCGLWRKSECETD